MQFLALICAVQICCLLPTKPLPPPHQSPSSLCEVVAMTICLLLSHIWSKERERLQHYASDMLWLLWETVRGRRRREEVYSVHQNLPSNPGGERNQVFPFQNTHTWHLSRVSTEHWTPCCPVSSPDQNTGKIVAYFTAGNNKMLFIHKGTKNLLETSFTAEKTLTSSQASFKNNSLQQRHWLPYICHVVSNWMSWMGPVYMGLRRQIMFHVILKDKLHFLVVITHQWKGKGYQAL